MIPKLSQTFPREILLQIGKGMPYSILLILKTKTIPSDDPSKIL